MEMPSNRTWMYNRLLPGRRGYTDEFLKGLDEFLNFIDEFLPPFTEFYFRTHRKKDNSWVCPRAESAYKKYEQRKIELSSQSSTFVSGEINGGGSSQQSMPSDIDIWVDSVGGKKKGRIFGLGSVGRTLITSSSKPTNYSTNLEDANAIRREIQALNESLQRQEYEKIEIKNELSETKKQLAALMQHLGFIGSSSHPSSSPQSSNEYDDDDNHLDMITLSCAHLHCCNIQWTSFWI